MRRGKKESVSVWQNGKGGKIGLSTVSKDLSVDVCIVGAGIAGLTIGYFLAREGKDVIILDAWELCAGETSRTTAHLTSVLDQRFFELESFFGKEKTRLAAQSHSDAIDMIESIIKQERIDCDFERVDGYLVALDEKQKKDFTKESDAIKQAGIVDREVLDEVTLKNVTIKNAIRVPSQAMFNISSYMLGLALAFEKLGGKIHNRTHVTEVKGGKITYAKTDGGFKIEAKHIVVATNTPINDLIKMHTKQAAYRTYVIAYEVPKRSYSGFLIWDMERPYHYARIVRGNEEHDLLVIGGQDHKVGQENDAAKRYHNLDNWAKKYFKILGPIKNQWSGQVMEAVDSLAFIGHNPGEEKNIYIVTGTSGNGITYGTIAGVLIADLIHGRENPWKEIYDPARKSLKSVGTYIEENADVLSCMVKDWLSPSEVKNVSDIKAGEGAILRKGASKIAVYRDDKGELHESSAVCPHLGCVVQWNSGEKSWDCPCHGSRFDCCEGRILNGPAISRLAPIAKES